MMHFIQPEDLPGPLEERPFFNMLTQERSRIVAHIALGLTNEQIKSATCRTVSTVKNTQGDACQTLGIRGDRISLTALAHASGWYEARGRGFISTEPSHTRDQCEKAMGRLTKRQLEVLELRASGMTIDEEARILEISPKTVRNHHEDILISFHEASIEPRFLSMHATVAAVWLEGLIEVEPIARVPNISQVA